MSSKLLSVVLMNNASMWHLNRESPFSQVKGRRASAAHSPVTRGFAPFETDGADISGALAVTCHAILSILRVASVTASREVLLGLVEEA
jgi:hypothetical protein